MGERGALDRPIFKCNWFAFASAGGDQLPWAVRMGDGMGADRRGNRSGKLLWMTMTVMGIGLLAGPAEASDWQRRLGELERGAPLLASLGSVELAQGDQIFELDIPSLPLPQAIARLSAATGLQVLYTGNETFARTAPAIAGSYTAEQALRLLLAGSGLTYRFVTGGAVTLEALPAAASGEVTLPTMTVTAERFERSIRDTATSVQVFDAGTLSERPALESTNDVLERVPNVTSSGTTNLAPAIRGIDGTGPAQGADAFFAGTRPRLNVQVDGRPASYNEVVFGDFSLWDVEQVEVLRGPQSTLQGRNAMAGTVVIKTKDPTYHYEAAGQAVGGNRSFGQLSAAISGPLVADQVAARLAVDGSRRKSFVDGMTTYPESDDPDQFESLDVRGKLLVEPEAWEDFSALLTINHSYRQAPQVETVLRPFDEHVVSYPPMNVFEPRTTSAILETTYDVTDTFAFETTLSATDLRVRRFAEPGDGNAEIDGHELVAEPRLRYESGDGRLSGVAGAYLFRAAQDESILLTFISPDRGRFDDSTSTEAVFAEATYEVLENIDVTAGARLEQEHRRREGAIGVFSVDLDETNRMFLPKLGLAWHATDELTVGAVASKGYNGAGAGFTFDVPFRNFVFEEEEAWTYEAYARAELDGGRLALTGNVFFSDYKNFQLSYDGNPDPTIWSVYIRNVDKVHTYGAELGATWLATPELELFAGLGLLQTEVVKDSQAAIDGNELPRAPAFTIDAGAIYRHASGLELAADARFSDGYYSTIDNSSRDKTDPFVVVNAQAGYRLNDNLRTFAFVTNLFDSSDEILLEPGATPADDAAAILTPRTFGIGLQVNF